jgi:putative membrane protein
MENKKRFKTALLQTALMIAISLVMSSFSSSQKANDAKPVANVQNEAKDTNISKEKDAKFLTTAAEINLEEIKLGQLAQQKSTMKDVKDLGQMIETDHSKNMEKLTTLAKKESIDLPSSLTDKGNDAYEKLSKLSGTSFDKEYCDMMVSGHKEAISEYEKEIKGTKNSDIKAFATTTLLDLRKHLEHATTCKNKYEKMK